MPGPPSTAAAPTQNAIDRALAFSASGEHAKALRWAAAEVKCDRTGPVALLVTARLVHEMGREEAGLDGLKTAVGRAIESGDLPIAVAASSELRRLGAIEDVGPMLDAIADAFEVESDRLLEKGGAPPQLDAERATQPLADAYEGEGLLDEVESILGDAAEQLQRDIDQPAQVKQQVLFSSLGKKSLRAFIELFRSMDVDLGVELIEQGAMGDDAYVLARGELEVQRATDAEEPIRLARLGRGALFGEMALLSRAPRAASSRACSSARTARAS